MLDRRQFLERVAGTTLVLAAGCGGGEDVWDGADLALEAQFPDGVIAGPEPEGVHLVVRLAELAGARRLGLEIATDAGFAGIVVRTVVDVPAGPEPLHVVVPLPGVAAGQRCHYRFVTRRRRSPAGAFRLRRADDDASPVRLGVFSCQGWQAGYFAAHAGLAAEPDLDLVVSLGDYIYELTDDFGPADRVDPIGLAGDGFAETLEEYRQKYQLYRSDPDLRAMHAAHGLVAVWDNHELADDGAGHLQGRVPRVPLAERQANGRAAFWEYQPMTPGAPASPLYRSLRVGANLELFLLDLHTHAEPPGPAASYLGAAQRAWLWDGLAASGARWKVIASSTVMMGLDLSADVPVNTNQWDGYPDERAALVAHIRDGGIQGVVAVSGDLHTYLAAPVTSTGRAGGAHGFHEVCAGAISSLGLLDLPPGEDRLARALESLARGLNPHLAFMDVLARGYAVIEARRDELLVTLRAVEDVYQRVSPMRDLAVLRLVHGQETLEVTVPA